MKSLVTRPQHDVTTRYLSSWAFEVMELAKDKGVDVVDLQKEKANIAEFSGRMEKIKPGLVFLNGHGDDTSIAGHDNNIIVAKGINSSLLEGKITYALSCNSAKELGQSIACCGRSVFIGYLDKFVFVSDRNFVNRPADDPKAQPFKDASNQVMFSLLKGRTANDASRRSIEKFKSLCLKFSSSSADSDSLQIAQCLWWNSRNQTCLGE